VYNPIHLTDKVKQQVVKNSLRKYYRLARGGRWYGGIATADCVGCNLKCIFCWSGMPRDFPEKIGKFYSPEKVYSALTSLASKRKYKLVRISGNEPTIGRKHLLEVLELVDRDGRFTFILETNGILIGYDKNYAKELAKYSNLHVRVSIKGACPEEFSKLTGAAPNFFDLQLKALEHLLNYGVSCHPAVMVSFSSNKSIYYLKEKLGEIDVKLVRELEEEYVILYPHVVERLKRAGIKPKVYYNIY